MRRSLVLLLGSIALGGCLHEGGEDREAAPPSAVNRPRSGVVTIEGRARPASTAAYVVGRHAVGVGSPRSTVRLGGAVNAALIGALAPVAVPAPGGARAFAYTSSLAATPVVRVYDTGARRDTVVDRSALSVAWGKPGLAYFKASRPRLGDPRRYLGHVVVRQAPGARPNRWTPTAGRYVVAAWAERSLLVYRLRLGWPDLLVLDGPRRTRLLARAAALVAVSPDGRRAFVSTYGAQPAVVRVLDVASGREEARLGLGRQGVRWVTESGSWVGDDVAAPASTGVVVFHVAPRRISVEQMLRFESDAFPVLEPRADAAGRYIVARVELAPRPREPIPGARLLRCDRLTLRCASVVTGSSADPPTPLYNPSRP
jgi:hypothetical protein